MGIFFPIVILTNFAILLEDSSIFCMAKLEKQNSRGRLGTVS
jgi:hypothetical protein